MADDETAQPDEMVFNMGRAGHSGSTVTIRGSGDGQVHLRVDVDDDHYNGEMTLSTQQLELLHEGLGRAIDYTRRTARERGVQEGPASL